MFLIGNGKVITRDPSRPFIENGAVAVEGDSIVGAGTYRELKKRFPRAEEIDAKGGVIMPGLINAHTHFYGAMLKGSALCCREPRTVCDVLAGRSWKLDRNMELIDCVNAAYASLIECIRNGVTAVFDHHASYGCISGSLPAVAGAVEEAGIRACLAFETSERCGYEACCRAIDENADFIDYCAVYGGDRLRAMFGLHAPFTLSDLDISACVRKNGGRVGFHTHVSEGLDDLYYCRVNYGKDPVERLDELGVLDDRAILAHCVHVSESEIELIRKSGAAVVNMPQSNMNNGVGAAPVSKMLEKGVKVGLGTDNYASDMLESARAYVLLSRHESHDPGAGLDEAAAMLFSFNRDIASRAFGKELGVIREGAAADIVIMDFRPFTGFNAENADAHLIMGGCGRMCSMTMAAGKVLMLDGKLTALDEEKLAERIRRSSEKLWKRIDERAEYEWTPVIS